MTPPPPEPLEAGAAINLIAPDLEAKDYVTEMIREEPPKDFESLYDLIGDFLSEHVEGDEERAKLLAWDLLRCLLGEQKFLNVRNLGKSLEGVTNLDDLDSDSEEEEDYPAPEKLDGDLAKRAHAMMETEEGGCGFQDHMLGVGTNYQKTNYNEVVEIGELVKARRAKHTKEKAAQMVRMKQWASQKIRPPAPVKIHRGLEQIGKVTDIVIDKFGVIIGGKELIQDTTLKIVIGRRYGLHGRNGTGKTCLLASLAKKEHPKIPKHIHIVTVEQELDNLATNESPLFWVLQVDTERSKLEKTIKDYEGRLNDLTDAESSELIKAQSRWEEIEADHAPHIASQILEGLGFDAARQAMPTQRLSGGWRARVALARALFADPDILLLDEPTNHLDVHAVAWLTQFLQDYDKTIFMVSHARDVLNEVCTDITHLNNQKLSFYRGNFDTFEKLYANQKTVLAKAHEKNEAEKAHMQQFIDKFRFNAKRASMVQSRIKALTRLPMLDEILSDPSLCFQFKDPEPIPTPILQLDEACFEYKTDDGISGKPFYLKDLVMNFDLESRICLVGENGSGKSTLLKLLVGNSDKSATQYNDNLTKDQEADIPAVKEVFEPSSGIVRRHNRLRIGYFTQHHMDAMDLTLNSIQNLMERYPKAMNAGEEAARNWLGQFGVVQALAVEPLYVLSGGQKSRVALALLAYSCPHIIVLDEPTNHLDLDAIQALVAGLTAFKGGVILVSHDTHFIESVCDEIWNVEGNTCKKFGGDIHDYKNWVLKRKLEAEAAKGQATM